MMLLMKNIPHVHVILSSNGVDIWQLVVILEAYRAKSACTTNKGVVLLGNSSVIVIMARNALAEGNPCVSSSVGVKLLQLLLMFKLLLSLVFCSILMKWLLLLVLW